jgi:transposase
MKGSYSGRHMTIYGTIVPKLFPLLRCVELSEKMTVKARGRLKIIDWHRSHGQNISLTSRRFGLSRRIVRMWVKRYNEKGMLALNDKSHRPQNLRLPTTASSVVVEIVKLRKQYPAWSKYKLQAILKRQGIVVSSSTIGRVLKRRGLINHKVSQKRKRAALKPKSRFPKGLRVANPGDMIQMDVKHITLVGGKRFYQFTAIDVLSKIRVLEIYPSESSKHGLQFLHKCLDEFPFPIQAIQTDNGSTFLKYFQQECERLNLKHYFIYPRHPKQNTYVEISHKSDKDEFYLQGNVSPFLEVMRESIGQRKNIWNGFRPHQALNYLTPYEYLRKWQEGRLPTRDVITLQT